MPIGKRNTIEDIWSYVAIVNDDSLCWLWKKGTTVGKIISKKRWAWLE